MSNDRIEEALVRLGAEHEPPPGWEARVLAAVRPPRRRVWWIALIMVIMIVAIGALLVSHRHAPAAIRCAPYFGPVPEGFLDCKECSDRRLICQHDPSYR